MDPIATRSIGLDWTLTTPPRDEEAGDALADGRGDPQGGTRGAGGIRALPWRAPSLPVSEVWAEVVGEAGRRAEVAIRLERQLERMR
jgi:hypothetical protein